MITVKLIVVPGPVAEFGLNDGATVSDLLSSAGQTVPAGYGVKVNGTAAETSAVLEEGAMVMIVTEAKGNS